MNTKVKLLCDKIKLEYVNIGYEEVIHSSTIDNEIYGKDNLYCCRNITANQCAMIQNRLLFFNSKQCDVYIMDTQNRSLTYDKTIDYDNTVHFDISDSLPEKAIEYWYVLRYLSLYAEDILFYRTFLADKCFINDSEVPIYRLRNTSDEYKDYYVIINYQIIYIKDLIDLK